MKSVEFKLSTVCKYHNVSGGGIHDEARHFIMTAPSVKMLTFSTPIKQTFFSQINKRAAKDNLTDSTVANDQGDGKITAQAVLMLLYMGDADLNKFMEDFKTLCIMGAVKYPNGEPITRLTIEEMESEDFERMMGEYLENFIIGSLLQTVTAS